MATKGSDGMAHRHLNQENNETTQCREKTNSSSCGVSLQECKGKESHELSIERTPSSIPKRR